MLEETRVDTQYITEPGMPVLLGWYYEFEFQQLSEINYGEQAFKLHCITSLPDSYHPVCVCRALVYTRVESV